MLGSCNEIQGSNSWKTQQIDLQIFHDKYMEIAVDFLVLKKKTKKNSNSEG